METDFTKYMIEDIENGEIPFYHNFCLLDENSVEETICDNIFPFDCIYEAKVYEKNIEMAIQWSLEYPDKQRIKILNYLSKKADRFTDTYCQRYKIDPDYEPNQDEIEKYMQSPYVEDFDEGLYIKLQEEAYDKAKDIYYQKHENEINGLTIIEKAKFNIEKHIFIQECKSKFVNKALKSKAKKRFSVCDFIPTGKNSNKEKLISLMKHSLLGKEGKGVAFLMIVWQKAGYLEIPKGKRASFYRTVIEDFGYNIGTNQSINKYLIKSAGELKKKREYAYFENAEIEKAVDYFSHKI